MFSPGPLDIQGDVVGAEENDVEDLDEDMADSEVGTEAEVKVEAVEKKESLGEAEVEG